MRVWRFGNCEFNELKRELRVGGAPVELEGKPLDVLHQLLTHSGEVVTKEQLLDAVWPGVSVVDGSLATAVSKLRKALGADGEAIVTIARIGYRFAVPVHRVAEPSTPPVNGAAAQPIENRQIANAAGASVSRARPRWALAAVFAIGAAVAGSVWWMQAQNTAPLESQITSLAVLPLLDMSGDASEDYFADGMTEALIVDLSKIRALRVISRTSVMQYKGTKKPLPQIARELNVDGIVEGSVARSGDRVRVSARLIRAATETALWAENYDRDLHDILNLQRELARRVSREIRITVRPSEHEQLTTSARVDPKAHEQYLRGRFFWNRRTRDDLLKAADYFQEATTIDPDYALAYAGLADAYADLLGFGHLSPSEASPKATAAARKAIALDPSLAEPHAALAYAEAASLHWVEAEQEFHRALELNPGYAVALYQYGFYLSLMGRQDEAIALTERALAVDPLSPIVRYRAGRVYYHARQFEKAIEQFQRILELDPNDQLGLYGLGLVYAAQKQFDKAIPYLSKQNLQRGFDATAAYAASGQIAEARRRLAAGIRTHREQNAYLRPGWVAEVYIGLGERDEAFRWLERAYIERDSWLALLKVWPPFDPLRSDPRFADLLRRMNFPETSTATTQ